MVKITRRGLYLLMFVMLLMAIVHGLQTQHFLSRAISTEAQVVGQQKQLLFYSTTVRFLSKHETVIDGTITTAAPVTIGQKVPVRFNELIPAQVRIEGFLQTWFDLIVDLVIFVLSVLFLLLFNFVCSWRTNRQKKLRTQGHRVLTKFKGVEKQEKTDDGRHTYRIVSSWHDPKSNKTYEFRSKHMWKDPSDYLMDQTIQVVVDVKNKRRYMMDLKFLPENLFK